MHTKSLWHIGGSIVLSVLVCSTAYAQELPPIYPGVTTLGERTIPAPVGISPEMLEIVKERQVPPVISVPATTEDWLQLQALFDVAGNELGRAAAVYNEAIYEVREIAGVRTYTITPKKINARWGNRVFLHTHGGAFVFGGGDSALRRARVESDLHVYDGQTHGDYMQNLIRFVPKSEDAQRELHAFFDKHLK